MIFQVERSEEELVRLHFCHMAPFAEKLVNAMKLQKKIEETEFITFYIVWSKGRMSYNEDDSIDSFFSDKNECIEYVKKENDNCRSHSEYYWEEHRIRNPFRLQQPKPKVKVS